MHLNPESPLGCLPSGMSIAFFRSSETKGALEAQFSLPNAVSRRGGMTVSHLDRKCNRVVCSVDTGSMSRPKISTVVLVLRRTFMTIWKRRPGRPRSRSRSQQAPTDSRRAATATGRRRRPPTVIVPRPTVVAAHRRRPAPGRRHRPLSSPRHRPLSPPTDLRRPATDRHRSATDRRHRPPSSPRHRPSSPPTHRHRSATNRRRHPPSPSRHLPSSPPTVAVVPPTVVVLNRRCPTANRRRRTPSSSRHRLSSQPTVVVVPPTVVVAHRRRRLPTVVASHRRHLAIARRGRPLSSRHPYFRCPSSLLGRSSLCQRTVVAPPPVVVPPPTVVAACIGPPSVYFTARVSFDAVRCIHESCPLPIMKRQRVPERRRAHFFFALVPDCLLRLSVVPPLIIVLLAVIFGPKSSGITSRRAPRLPAHRAQLERIMLAGDK